MNNKNFLNKDAKNLPIEKLDWSLIQLEMKNKMCNDINDSLLKCGLNEDILDKNASNLSGCQRQKILILRAVLSNPEFIVFDEPMSSLDLKSQLEIIRIIKNLIKNNNLTMLFITHDFRLIQDLCDKVFVLSNGSIVEKGSTIEVFKNPQHDETKRLLQVVK